MGLRLAVALAAILLVAAIFAAPWLPLLYLPFAPVCHQIAGRSFHLHGVPLAVCARCLGIYAGVVAAAIHPLKVRTMWIWALVAVNGLDFVLEFTNNSGRCLLGFLLAWLAISLLLDHALRETDRCA
jgi:hypothetical protein